MIKKFVLVAFSTSIVGFGWMLWLCYCAGRWGKISFIGAETVGFVAISVGVLISMLCLRKSGIMQRMTRSILHTFVTIGIVIGVLAAVRAASFHLLLRTYAAGFEKTALEVAPMSKWQSLLPLAQTFLTARNTNMLEKVLPAFVSKVYPNNLPYCGIGGDPEDLNVVVQWRQPTLVIGIIIGRHGGLNGELFRQRCADDVAIVVAR
jgi:hypothetical protein